MNAQNFQLQNPIGFWVVFFYLFLAQNHLISLNESSTEALFQPGFNENASRLLPRLIYSSPDGNFYKKNKIKIVSTPPVIIIQRYILY